MLKIKHIRLLFFDPETQYTWADFEKYHALAFERVLIDLLAAFPDLPVIIMSIVWHYIGQKNGNSCALQKRQQTGPQRKGVFIIETPYCCGVV
jgi:hypothetical protein